MAKIISCMMMALVALAGPVSAQIFDYKLAKSNYIVDGVLYKWSTDAYLIDNDDGTLSIISYSKKYKKYDSYDVEGGFGLYDRGVAGFIGIGVPGFEQSLDVGTGKYKPSSYGLASLTISGSHVDPEYTEHGSFKIKINAGMTKKANSSGIELYYDYVIAFLESKGFQPIE